MVSIDVKYCSPCLVDFSKLIFYTELLMEEFRSAHQRMFGDKNALSSIDKKAPGIQVVFTKTVDKIRDKQEEGLPQQDSVPNNKIVKPETPAKTNGQINDSPKKEMTQLTIGSKWKSSSLLAVNTLSSKTMNGKNNNVQLQSVKKTDTFLTPRVETSTVSETIKILTSNKSHVSPSAPNVAFQLLKSSSCLNVNDKSPIFMIPRVKQFQTRRHSQLLANRIKLFEY